LESGKIFSQSKDRGRASLWLLLGACIIYAVSFTKLGTIWRLTLAILSATLAWSAIFALLRLESLACRRLPAGLPGLHDSHPRECAELDGSRIAKRLGGRQRRIVSCDRHAVIPAWIPVCHSG
jgi:hypothetical protein